MLATKPDLTSPKDRSYICSTWNLGVIMDLGGWLRNLGLERYEGAFRENDIDETVLTNLTAEDLKELGVTAIGHRRKLLDAIAALAPTRPQAQRRSSPYSSRHVPLGRC